MKQTNFRKRKPNGYWTKENIFSLAKTLTYKSEFRSYTKPYSIALKNGWLNEMTWLRGKRKQSGYWTKEMVFEESKKYKSRSSFKKCCSSAYNVAKKNKWLNEMDWLLHQINFFEEGNYVYSYVDKQNKIAYVGLTIDVKRRHKQHLTQIDSAVYKYFHSNNIETPQPILLEENVSKSVSQIKEREWLLYYKRNGYTILNKGSVGLGVGSLGATHIKWSKDKVIEISKQYKSKSEFEKNNGGAYQSALKNGWLDEMDWLKRPTNYNFKCTKEYVFEESKKYKTISEFNKYSRGSYEKARKNGWLDEMTWLVRQIHKDWDKDSVFTESSKYSTRSEFRIGSYSAYDVARKNGWLNELFPKKIS